MNQIRTVNLDLGTRYRFVLTNGQTREVVMRGSESSNSGDILIIEVDGVQGEFRDINEAIGPYISFSEV